MKKLIVFMLCIFVLISLCSCNNSSTELEALRNEIEALRQENELLQNNLNGNEPDKNKPSDGDITEIPSDKQENILSEVWEFLQPEVAEKLKQPETAEFNDISTAKFYEISKDTYEVLGSVKGQNSLGNMVLNYFCATAIMDSTGHPSMISNVEFLGKESFDDRIFLNEQIKERTAKGETYLSADELADEILKQPLYVKETKYIDSSNFSYSSYSMLQAVLYNNSEVPIKSAVVAFVAWDKNRLPVKIEQRLSLDASYFKKINYNAINLMSKETYSGKNKDTYFGMEVNSKLDISHLKAIVISYEDFDGNTWDNPLVLDFKHLYEEKRLLD